jgi:hypothetical protein
MVEVKWVLDSETERRIHHVLKVGDLWVEMSFASNSVYNTTQARRRLKYVKAKRGF